MDKSEIEKIEYAVTLDINNGESEKLIYEKLTRFGLKHEISVDLIKRCATRGMHWYFKAVLISGSLFAVLLTITIFSFIYFRFTQKILITGDILTFTFLVIFLFFYVKSIIIWKTVKNWAIFNK